MNTTEDAASASRYDVLAKIASGGMATVFVGALKGGGGLRHLVALKRPHQHLLDDPGFRESLLAEANVASGIRHANVVSVREIERLGDSIQLVMDYVEGASLGQLLVHAAKSGPPVPAGVALRIVLDASAGLEALHELTDDAGKKLGFVHRDVSPQNILVGVDGVARITDFGLAKCAETSEQPTTKGTLKGKLGYMAPEYIRSKPIDARADVFAMGIVAWEALAGKRLFRGESDADTIERVLTAEVLPPSSVASGLTPEIDAAVLRALERSPEARFPTIRAFADAIGAAAKEKIAPATEVGAVVRESMGGELAARRRAVGERFATETTVGAVAREGGAKGQRGGRAVVIGAGAIAIVVMGAVAVVRSRAGHASSTEVTSSPSSALSPPGAASTAPLPVASSIAMPSPSASASTPAEIATPPAPAAPTHAPKRHHSPSPPRTEPSVPTPKAPPPNPYAP
jgi:eukaryotic-like serine/threonine-protein kinase